MSTIQDARSVPSATTRSPYGTRSARASTADDLQDRFLKLLVTQMKNQDPLNPLDNAEVTTQLAQISTVSGIERLNATIQAMASSFSEGQALQAVGMIGKDVLVPGAALQLAGGNGVFGIDLAQPADQVKVTIQNEAGRVVQVMDLGAQAAGYSMLKWDGRTSDGGQAADGSYSMSITALRGGQKMEARTLTSGTVHGISLGSAGARLEVGGVGGVGLADVKQIF